MRGCAGLIQLGALALAACADPGGRVELIETDQPEYEVARAVFDDAGVRAIHAIGIYEGSSNHGRGEHLRHAVRIVVDRQSAPEIQLALSSYEPVRWEIVGEGAEQVVGVFLDGYHRHEITGLSGARVVNVSGHDRSERELASDWGPSAAAAAGAASVPCAYTFPGPSGGGCAAGRRFMAEAEDALGAKAGSFTGVYNGAAFRLPDMSFGADD